MVEVVQGGHIVSNLESDDSKHSLMNGYLFTCGSDKPAKVYWSKKSDPNEWPKMKLAIWQTIKWRLHKWFRERIHD
jgi:hypothetical protein